MKIVDDELFLVVFELLVARKKDLFFEFLQEYRKRFPDRLIPLNKQSGKLDKYDRILFLGYLNPIADLLLQEVPKQLNYIELKRTLAHTKAHKHITDTLKQFYWFGPTNYYVAREQLFPQYLKETKTSLDIRQATKDLVNIYNQVLEKTFFPR